MTKRGWRRLRRGVFALLGIVVAIGAGAWLTLRGSLPRLDGTLALSGLASEVTVERDAIGVVTLRGTTRRDITRALGFVHAQDRFFQMDLLRRAAAGELSALIGPATIEADLDVRLHRLRARSAAAFARLTPEEKDMLQTYAEGVNAGLAALRVRSFEYLALRAAPEPWRPEDSLLAAYAMFLDLQNTSGRRERSQAVVRKVFSPELAAFLLENGSAWSARIDGTSSPILPVPGPEHFQFLAHASQAGGRPIFDEAGFALGSNNWAIAGGRTTRGGGAMVANDMHLSLRDLPGVWYRVRWIVDGSENQSGDVCGVTLPGVPLLVVGSNGHVAWGFTNATIDTVDLVEVSLDPAHADRYLTPEGSRELVRHEEIIRVRGGAPVTVTVEETIWGPLRPRESASSEETRHAIMWIAHDPARVSFRFGAMEHADGVEDALAIAAESWLPAQNIVVGDRAGSIGWTIAGTFPERRGFDGTMPVSLADGARGWEKKSGAHPTIVDPADGLLWTANAQAVGGDAGRRLGDGGLAVDGRAWQIRERLRAREKFDELALFEIQCDSEVRFLVRWRELLRDVLDEGATAGNAARAECRRLIEAWDGSAAIDSAGYPLVRQFRREVAARVLGRLLAPCRAEFAGFSIGDIRYEEPLWLLVNTRPAWAAAREGWRAELLAAVDATIARTSRGGERPDEQTWGRSNRLDMCHPFARFAPQLRSWLGVPRVALPGDSFAPNAFTGRHGPSQRMVVSPGREAAGIMHIPGGQCGHPLSPFFRAGHDDWVRQVPSPFLPGETRHRLTLEPER